MFINILVVIFPH